MELDITVWGWKTARISFAYISTNDVRHFNNNRCGINFEKNKCVFSTTRRYVLESSKRKMKNKHNNPIMIDKSYQMDKII